MKQIIGFNAISVISGGKYPIMTAASLKKPKCKNYSTVKKSVNNATGKIKQIKNSLL